MACVDLFYFCTRVCYHVAAFLLLTGFAIACDVFLFFVLVYSASSSFCGIIDGVVEVSKADGVEICQI